MKDIKISLSDDGLAKLKKMANCYGVTPEELARVGNEELLARPKEDFLQGQR